MPEFKYRNCWKQEGVTLDEIRKCWESSTDNRWEEEWNNSLLITLENEMNEVIGFSRAEKKWIGQLKSNLYQIHCFIIPSLRLNGLGKTLLSQSIEFLESVHQEDQCLGVYCWVTDPQLKARKNEAIWPYSKMIFLSSSPEGHHLRVRYFKNTVI